MDDAEYSIKRIPSEKSWIAIVSNIIPGDIESDMIFKKLLMLVEEN